MQRPVQSATISPAISEVFFYFPCHSVIFSSLIYSPYTSQTPCMRRGSFFITFIYAQPFLSYFQICKKTFKRPQDLKKHEKIHTEEHHVQHKHSKAVTVSESVYARNRCQSEDDGSRFSSRSKSQHGHFTDGNCIFRHVCPAPLMRP